MRYRKLTYLVTLLSLTVFSACEHKELDFSMSDGSTRVVFDWALASQADPDGMRLMAFSGTSQPVTLHYADREGGALSLPGGAYQMAAHNDNTEYVQQRGNTWEAYELYSMETSLVTFSPMFATTRTIPRAKGTESQVVIFEPDPMWCAAEPSFLMDGANNLTLSMEPATEQYTFTITGVVNIENVVEAAATISGMAGSYYPALQRCGSYDKMIPFNMVPGDGDVIKGSFRTFGNRLAPDYLSQDQAVHVLVVYMVITDGSKYYATFDVTDAVHDAQKKVAGSSGELTLDVTINEFVVPEPLTNGSGLHPEVSEWQEVDITIRM